MTTSYYVVQEGKPDHLLMQVADHPPEIGTTITFTGAAKLRYVVIEVHRTLNQEGASAVVRLRELPPT